MFIPEDIRPVPPPRKGPRRETVEYKAFKVGNRTMLPCLAEKIIDAGEDIRLTNPNDDDERVLSRRFGLTRQEIYRIVFAVAASYRRGYRSQRLATQSGLLIAEQVRQQTMEEVAS